VKYRFAFTSYARRQLRAIDRAMAMRILEAFTPLGDDPYRPDADVRKLTGHGDRYRLRVGDYRVIYRIDNDELIIEVIDLGHRGRRTGTSDAGPGPVGQPAGVGAGVEAGVGVDSPR
jgi:mRNA interferase RelE/StbE